MIKRLQIAQLTMSAAALLVLAPDYALAGGPKYVAGVSEFQNGLAGTPITWSNGNLIYFSDQGSLGSMAQPDADAFVADAISRWTSVPTAALTATHGGTLDEDVNGSNVIASAGSVTLPLDIQSTATDKPLAIVYDTDGAVIDALMGIGASDPALCNSNSVFVTVDGLSVDAHFSHELLILNGRCAQTPAQLAPFRYQLVRAVGQILGLGWSQTNQNIQSGIPPPTSADINGAPIMFPVASLCCRANADQLRMDDRAAISKLYPVTPQNVANFSGKQITAAATIRIHGDVKFANGQPMQGVNVVARLIDPVTGLPSATFVSSSVSGFLFRGDAGNIVTGFNDANGHRLDRFGSSDQSIEGTYDLAGLELPIGSTTVSYQLTLESVSPLYQGDSTVGPYLLGTPSISGTIAPLPVFNLSAGSDVVRNITVANSSRPLPEKTEPNSFLSPAPLPSNGELWGWLNGYADTDFFFFSGKNGRTLDFRVTTLNEANQPTTDKALPALGVWLASDPPDTPARVSQHPFNSGTLGVTDLQASINQDSVLKIGLADQRGDGRPDFYYHAKLLYADDVTPNRLASASMSTVSISGIGFKPGMTVSIGGASATVSSVSPTRIIATAPALAAGPANVTITEPASGASVTMTDALIYGADQSDHLVNVSVPNPSVPLGTDAPNPFRIRVLDINDNPVANVAVAFSISPTQSRLLPCNLQTCTVITDAVGEAEVIASPGVTGANVITASLGNGATLQTTVVASSSATDLAAISPLNQVLAGASFSFPLTMKLMGNGLPLSGRTINLSIGGVAVNLSSTTTVTDANGLATVTATSANLSGTSVVTACTAGNGACTQFQLVPIAATNIKFQVLQGNGQIIPVGLPIQPIVFRLVDSGANGQAVRNAPVTVSILVTSPRKPPNCNLPEGGCRFSDPKIFSNTTVAAQSDANGIVSITPAVQSSWGPVDVSLGITVSGGLALNPAALINIVNPTP